MTCSRALLLAVLLVPSIHAEEPSRRGALGLTIRPPRDAAAGGAEVARLEIGSAAYGSTLRPGDRIIEVNGASVEGPATLIRHAAEARAGDTLTLRYQRGDVVEAVELPVSEVPRERTTADVTIEYEWVTAPDGTPLRIIVTRPTGASPGPAVLLVPEVGTAASDEPSYPYYSLLARALAREGIVAVRYDPRGVGDSFGGPYSAVELPTEVADVLTILRALLEDDRVDRRGVYLMGLGYGSVTAVRAAARHDGVAGLITWGGISRPFLETIVQVTREVGNLARVPAAELNARVRRTLQFFGRLLDGMAPTAIVDGEPQLAGFVGDDGTVRGKNARYWRQIDRTRYAQLLGNTAWPLHVLYGEHDYLACLEDQKNAVALASARGARQVRFSVIAGCDHFMNAASDRPAAYLGATTRSGQFQADAVHAVAQWIRELSAVPEEPVSP